MLAEIGDVHAAQPRQPERRALVAPGGGRRAEDQRVGQNAGQQQPGDLRRRHGGIAAARFRDQRGGAADRLDDKRDRQGGGRVAETVMVQNADNLGFVRPRHSLGQLVVVYQNQLGAGRLQQTSAGLLSPSSGLRR